MVRKDLLQQIQAETPEEGRKAKWNEYVRKMKEYRAGQVENVWAKVNPPGILNQIVSAASQGKVVIYSGKNVIDHAEDIVRKDGIVSDFKVFDYAEAQNLPLPKGTIVEGPHSPQHQRADYYYTARREGRISIGVKADLEGVKVYIRGGGETDKWGHEVAEGDEIIVDHESTTFAENLNSALKKAWEKRIHTSITEHLAPNSEPAW